VNVFVVKNVRKPIQNLMTIFCCSTKKVVFPVYNRPSWIQECLSRSFCFRSCLAWI